MSQLTIVRHALETNPEVIIVNVQEKNYLPDRNGFFCHTMDYLVAPKNGLYTADELQSFMMGLVPDLKPTQQDDFRQCKNGDLELGRLYFDEKVGEERIITRRILTLTDEGLLNVAGFVNGKQTIDREITKGYERRTWVNLFPCEAFVRDLLDMKLKNNSGHRVEKSDLERYGHSLVQRLIGRK